VAESLPLVDRGLPAFVIPFLNEDTRIYVFNPGTAAVTGTLEVRSQTGAVLTTATVTLPAMGSDSRSLRDLIGSAPAAGQIVGNFPALVVGSASFGTASTLNLVAAQAPNLTGSMYVPFFAAGAGFESDLDLVNSATQTVTISAQLLSMDGAPVGNAQSITLASGAQSVTALSRLFQLSSFTTGYVRISVPQGGFGPFISYPAITGYVRIRSGQTASTVLPFAVYPQTDTAVLNSGTAAGSYEGIAVLNPGPAATVVTLQALSATGAVLGSVDVSLPAGKITSRQISEYFDVSIPEGSVIRVSCATPVVTTAITGSMNGDTLRSSPGLR
jgi:hypothetical protein